MSHFPTWQLISSCKWVPMRDEVGRGPDFLLRKSWNDVMDGSKILFFFFCGKYRVRMLKWRLVGFESTRAKAITKPYGEEKLNFRLSLQIVFACVQSLFLPKHFGLVSNTSVVKTFVWEKSVMTSIFFNDMTKKSTLCSWADYFADEIFFAVKKGTFIMFLQWTEA